MTDTLPHLLLVDDSPLVTEALALLFAETGHRVSVAARVAEAVTACGRDAPDLILLDVTLGAEDGLDLLAELRATGRPLPRTLAMTGHDDPKTRERCLAAGCAGVLVKPVPTRELLRIVGEFLPV
jgi:CheY-like chemotaxis protein